ncbi:HNH endonuclease [Candidatus Protofrankia datiscae]|uniref:HNH endonuclease n=1 Tax=Candidatus Protofrankia datiscae TaxID=2716812 RepID=F8AX97_9ACTN|nr:HNH endonuclease [Candidatus Protofrankia datiscae]AEH08448.1 HNH endonuclease [Candidatus Protofrankia datiscae]
MSVANPATRRYLFAAFGGRCGYCLTATADHLDHLVPRAAGGSNSRFNLIPACTPCGRSKGALSIADWVSRQAAGATTTGAAAPPAPAPAYPVPRKPVTRHPAPA